ncbi:MAG: DHHW family protein [Acutalibacteraceae bacterium]
MDNRTIQHKPQKKKTFNSRKRQGVEHGFSVISIVILMLVFFLTAIFLLVFPRSTVSNIEKRKLATFPEFSLQSYFSGAFTAGITNYYDDTVPYRDDFKNMGNNFKSVFGFHTDDEVKVIGKPINVVSKPESKPESKPDNNETSNTNSNPESSAAEQSSQVSEESKPKDYTVEDPDASYENGMIVVKQDGHYRALELFGGGSGNNYVKALNNFHKDLGDSVKIYSMIAPLASEYYTPSNYSQYNSSQKECFDSIASRLDDGIVSVDITDVLAKHTEEPIYCRTDHHWQPLGAYYAAQAFASAAGVDFKDLSTFTKKENEGFVGTMYAFSGDANILNDPETFTYYVPSNIDKCTTYYYDTSFNYTGTGNFFNIVDTPNSYLVFMGGDEQVIKVKTNVKNGRKLCIVKDSYGNAEPPYYMNGFEEIYVVDMRYFNLNLVDFVKEMGVTDLLFTMVSYSAVGENADNLENLRTQAKGQKIVDEALTAKNED